MPPSQRRTSKKHGHQDESEVFLIGYLEDGIYWISVTAETATPEQALERLAARDRRLLGWRVRGKRNFVLDEHETRVNLGRAVMIPVDGLDSDEPAYWELTGPDFVYGQEPWEHLRPPEGTS